MAPKKDAKGGGAAKDKGAKGGKSGGDAADKGFFYIQIIFRKHNPFKSYAILTKHN